MLFHTVGEAFARRRDSIAWSSDDLGKESTSFPICPLCEPVVKAVCTACPACPHASMAGVLGHESAPCGLSLPAK